MPVTTRSQTARAHSVTNDNKRAKVRSRSPVIVPTVFPVIDSDTELDNILHLNTFVDGFYTLFGLEHLQIKKGQEIRDYTKDKWNIIVDCAAKKIRTLVLTCSSKELDSKCNTLLEYVQKLKDVQPIVSSLFPTASICTFDLDYVEKRIKKIKQDGPVFDRF